MVSNHPLISTSSCPFNNLSVTVPRAPITIGINVTFMFHSFSNSLARSRHLSFSSLSFNFPLWSYGTEKTSISSNSHSFSSRRTPASLQETEPPPPRADEAWNSNERLANGQGQNQTERFSQKAQRDLGSRWSADEIEVFFESKCRLVFYLFRFPGARFRLGRHYRGSPLGRILPQDSRACHRFLRASKWPCSDPFQRTENCSPRLS